MHPGPRPGRSRRALHARRPTRGRGEHGGGVQPDLRPGRGDHRVEDVAPSNDPELLEVFGPTLMAIAFKAASTADTPWRPEGVEDVQEARVRPDQSRRGTAAHRGRGCARSAASADHTPYERTVSWSLAGFGPPSNRRPALTEPVPVSGPTCSITERSRYGAAPTCSRARFSYTSGSWNGPADGNPPFATHFLALAQGRARPLVGRRHPLRVFSATLVPQYE